MALASFFVLGAALAAVTSAPDSATLAAGNVPLHFRPDKGVLGDVMPFYWRGLYHVFYLKGPNWGHISSEDLVHWNDLPDAIEKGAEDVSPDGENCWTGSIAEVDGTFHMFYTGKNSRDPKGEQKVMHAVSKDLIAWSKLTEDTFYADGIIYWNKPVNGSIDDKLIYHHQAFRDPEVFRNLNDGKWWLLLHAALADGSSPAFARYESSDLSHWTPREPLLVFPKTLSGDCPHIFEADGRWYLLAADRHYTSAPAPEGPFSPDIFPYDCGELVVPKTMFDGKRRILLGWVADREGAKDSGKGTWGGVMSLPRELYPDPKAVCASAPSEKSWRRFHKFRCDRQTDSCLGEDSIPRLTA